MYSSRHSQLAALLRTTHPFPVSVVVMTSIAMFIVAHGGSPGFSVLIRGGLVVLASQIVVGSLNDYVDRHQDAQVQPDKPIPSGLVSPGAVLCFIAVAAAILLALGASFGPIPLVIACIGTLGGVAYDLWLKPTPFGLIGYAVGFLALFSWTWAIASHFTARLLLAYPIGVLILVAAHLANSYPDIETDQALGQRELSVLLGPVRTYRTILAAYAGGVSFGLAAAIITDRPEALALLALSALDWLLIVLTCGSAPTSIPVRERLFVLVGPGIGLLALGCLLAIR